MDENKYRKFDLILKAVIAFFLMCLMFASCGIKSEIGKIDLNCPSSVSIDNASGWSTDALRVRIVNR